MQKNKKRIKVMRLAFHSNMAEVLCLVISGFRFVLITLALILINLVIADVVVVVFIQTFN